MHVVTSSLLWCNWSLAGGQSCRAWHNSQHQPRGELVQGMGDLVLAHKADKDNSQSPRVRPCWWYMGTCGDICCARRSRHFAAFLRDGCSDRLREPEPRACGLGASGGLQSGASAT